MEKIKKQIRKELGEVKEGLNVTPTHRLHLVYSEVEEDECNIKRIYLSIPPAWEKLTAKELLKEIKITTEVYYTGQLA